MKSERRHHLQQNELAEHLGTARHRLEPFAVPALVTVVVVLVAVVAISLFRSRGAEQRSDATLGLLLSTTQDDPEAYHMVSTDFGGTQAATVATLAKADAFLTAGIEAMYFDREAAQDRLNDAIAAYREVIDSSQTLLLKSRASFGLAQALETQGELDAAVEAYQQVVALNESEGIVEVAQDRIEALQRPQTREFVSWFAEQKPANLDPAASPGLPDAGTLPEFPDFSLPDVSSPVTPSETESPTENAATEDAPTEGTPSEDAANEDATEPAEPAQPSGTEAPAADGAAPTNDSAVMEVEPTTSESEPAAEPAADGEAQPAPAAEGEPAPQADSATEDDSTPETPAVTEVEPAGEEAPASDDGPAQP